MKAEPRREVARPRPHEIGLKCSRDHDRSLEDYILGRKTTQPGIYLTLHGQANITQKQEKNDFKIQHPEKYFSQRI